MRPLFIGLVLALCVSTHLGYSNAAPADTGSEVADQQQKETLETLYLGEPSSDYSVVRDKRTIGPLRQLFPGLSQIVDRKIQQLTRSIFRVIGRLVLGGGAAGGGAGGSAGASSTSSGSGRKVSITLPTYPPGEDDEDEDEDEDSTPAASTSSPQDESSTPAEAENQLSGAESQISEVRVQLNDKPQAVPQDDAEDLKPAASGDNLADADEGELENETDGAADDENRNKRFLPFNLNGAAAGGGSSGGSGNFLFDIIRLIAGSGTTQERDEAENAPADGSTSSAGASASASAGASEGRDDGYQEGVPGPITRLFVIANRGIANLVQDLILRLAQTSERLVNFKARLITSII